MAETNLDIIIRAKDAATAIVKQLQAEIIKLEKRLKGLDSGTGKLDDDLEDAADSAEDLADNAEDAGDELGDAAGSGESLGGSLNGAKVAALALVAGVVAIAAAVFKATQGFFALEKAVIEVATLVDTAVVSNQELTDAVISLSNEFGQDVTDVAAGLYQAISAGANAGEEANEVLRVSLVLAKGALTDTATAVDIITTATNAFSSQGLEASRAADILFATVKAGKTNLDELAASFALVAPIAASVGISFEEINAAIATLTLGGTRTAQANTQIRAAIAGLLRPTEELTNIFNAAGFASAQAAFEQEGLAFAFDIVRQAVGDDIAPLQKLVGSIEGVNAIVQLTGDNLQTFARITDDVTDSLGNNDAAAAKVAATLQDQFTVATNQISNAFDQFGKLFAPIFTDLAQVLASTLTVIVEFVRENQELIQAVVNLAAVITGFIVVLGTLAIAFITLRVAIAFLSGPTGLSFLTKGFQLLGISGTAVTKILNILSVSFAKVKISTLALSGGLALALVAVVQLTLNLLNLNLAAQESAEQIERLQINIRGLVNRESVRSITALEGAIKNIASLTAENVKSLDKELGLRKQILSEQIAIVQQQLQSQEQDTIFGIRVASDEEIAQNQARLSILTGQLARTESALKKTGDRFKVLNKQAKATASQGLKDAEKIATALVKAFEDAQTGTNNFFSDLQSLNAFKFDNLVSEIESQLELQKSLAEAGGADANLLAQLELDATTQVLAIKEREIAERLALEERRVAKQAQLIARNVSDEVEAATAIQELSREALSNQIKSTTELIGIRQTAINSVRAQLASLVSAAASTQASFEATVRSINDAIRSNLETGLSDAQRFQSARNRINALAAQVRTAIANGEFEEAKRLAAEQFALIQSIAAIPTNEAGFNLISESANRARNNSSLETNLQLVNEIKTAEDARNQTAQGEALAFIERETQSIAEFKTALIDLGTLSNVVNLETNFPETLDNLELVQQGLTKLSTTAGGVKINLTTDQALLDILSGTQQVQVMLFGAEAILTVAGAFEQNIENLLTDAERIANLLKEAQGAVGSVAELATAPGFAHGGSVRGGGSGQSDSILARLSNGEFVMREAAVNKFGTGFFDRLNRLRIPRFAEGGAVGAIPTSQTATDEVSISLNLNKRTFNLRSDRDTALNLVRAFKQLETGLVGQ